MDLRIGVDLDNTLVCYDEAFRRAAIERAIGEGNTPGGAKERLRNALRAAGREDDWTELQGHVYGPGMASANLFVGAEEFFTRCRSLGVDVRIISHRTRFPYRGPQHDLHEAAKAWLAASVISDCRGSPLPVFLELTKEEKLARIAREECTHFIDDLPELLAEPGFPEGVTRILFDPHERHAAESRFVRAGSWREIAKLLLTGSLDR